MWQMIAEPGLRCAECRHNIQPENFVRLIGSPAHAKYSVQYPA